ncbi:MAG: tRNA lysidine(34) synthetase TilS, partial [Planctomycetota bacterium]
MNDTPQKLAVAVSGGSDSMALLDLMLWQGREVGFDVRAVTVDHGLRPEAKDEIAHVAAFCQARGIRHDLLTWDGWDGTGNLQSKARKARYALIRTWAARRGVDYVALGHTRDDQAETVLMRLARSSGVDGLAGMPERFERGGLTFIRPLLSQSRDELREYLRHTGIDWCEDPSNEDDSFERVRARKASKVLGDLGVDDRVLTRVAWHAQSASGALNDYLWKEVTQNGL